jgi:hypothetical protein
MELPEEVAVGPPGHMDDGVVRNDAIKGALPKRQLGEIALHEVSLPKDRPGKSELAHREIEPDDVVTSRQKPTCHRSAGSAPCVKKPARTRRAVQQLLEQGNVLAIMGSRLEIGGCDLVVPIAYDVPFATDHAPSLISK